MARRRRRPTRPRPTVALRLGRAGSPGRRVRAGLRRDASARPTASRCRLHHRPAPGARRRRRRPGRRGRRPVAVVHRDRERRSRYVGATPVFADVDEATQNLTRRDDRAVPAPPRTRAVILVAPGGRPGRPRRRCTRCATRAGSRSSRTPPARSARPTTAGPVGAGAELAAFSFHPRKVHHHR